MTEMNDKGLFGEPQLFRDGRTQIRMSVQKGLFVLEFNKDIGWIAMNKDETIRFIQAIANAVNHMAG